MSLEKRSPAILRFGVFEVDVRAGEVRKQGVRIKLQEQPFQVLKMLLERPGVVVTREDLRSRLWQADTFVDFDNGLNTSINKLREALGDSAERPRFIETLPRRGYRFIASVKNNDRKGPALTARSWKVLAPAAIVVLTVVAVTGGLIWQSRKPRLTEKDTIVLADFVNTTGDSVFDDTLKQGLRVQLEQSPFLNILSDQKVSDVLQMMKRSKDDRLTREVAREVCQRAGSKAFLIGTISSLGTQYVIGLNALNCQTGDELASEQVEADTREHVLRALGESATRMRKKLGESLATIQKYGAPMEQATTSSLDALKAYSLGMKTFFAKGVTASLPFFERVVELDPHFAMAHARVAMVHWNLNENALAAENMHKAYELRDKVTEWERLYIVAHYYDHGTGELEKAAQVYELWQQTYPRDWIPYNNLATLNAAFGKYEEALEEALQALRLEPENQDNYVVASFSYFSLNRVDKAAAVVKQAEERKLESEELLGIRYQLAFLRGDEGEMDRLVASAAGKPGAESSLWFCEVVAAAYEGRRSKSRGLARQEGEAAERNGAREEGATTWVAMAMNEGYFGDAGQARADARAALRLTSKGNVPMWGRKPSRWQVMSREQRSWPTN
jgi:DNA-binding winged helix-turn-helix (wHTH) protein/tetratricopeptide (TPR) repeat protein